MLLFSIKSPIFALEVISNLADRVMGSTVTVSLAMPLTSQKKLFLSSHAFFQPAPLRRPSTTNVRTTYKYHSNSLVQASMKEKAVTGLTALAFSGFMVMPEVAEAAGPGIPPSLKNLLLSVVAGGTVLAVIIGVVVAVSNFDPVKRD
ncbi:hypothetical protein GIB67_035592 [Kingdonia uniflora]|uniref:Ultraviolet-B-repressible protein n=1 Tax=Kingdonia uniflora TaxID=39325 RepID=A0A7J7LD68_9MAGN|nr:hypothetical protein GIB67_035592 [Kingdonia uniflora]